MANTIEREIWSSHIQDLFYRGNEFCKLAFDASEYVYQGKTVNIPNASAGGISASRNISSYPQTIVQRTDTAVSYTLDSFTSSPMLLTDIDQYQISYNKRESLLQECMRTVTQLAGDWMLYNWRPQTGSTNGINIILRTSGSSTSATIAGGTGNRSKLCLADLQAARLAFNKMNLPQEGRYIMIPSGMFDGLMTELNISTYRDASKAMDLEAGVIAKIYGWNILERSTVGVASSGSSTSVTLRSPGDTNYATDNEFALAWHRDCVESALGEVQFYGDDAPRPEYFGSIYSALLRSGGRHRRGNDYFGSLAIVQSN